MRSSFGPISYDHSPPGGYPHPNYSSEHTLYARPPIPIPRRPVIQAHIDESEQLSLQEQMPLGNEDLPVFDFREDIIEAVRENPVTIIVAETGAGKSTQVPQILLGSGDWNRIYLTQPRRPAAQNVFERIRQEIVAARGEEQDKLVGFETAGPKDITDDARIRIETDGLRLVRMSHDGGIGKDDVVIIDEVHEWNENIEILAAYMRRKIAANPNMHLVLMSATIHADSLARYFATACSGMPPIIEIPGRTYPVEAVEQPASTVVAEVVKAAETIRASQSEGGDEAANGILVFEPGKQEIADTIDAIRRQLPREIAAVATILPLHAKLSNQSQAAAFRKYPGVKIVVATDVAQTSLTIPDIAVVVDSGLQRRIELDKDGVEGLVIHNVSQADCDQRKGRTGRVGPGTYILTRLDANTSYVPYLARDKYPMPQILRTDVMRTVLRAAGSGIDMGELELLHPIDGEVVSQAQARLRTLGAFDEHNAITSLGAKMDELPLRPMLGRMMVESYRYSENTRAYMAAITASVEAGGLPYFAPKVGKRWQELSEEVSSDLLTQLDIFIASQDMTVEQLVAHDLDVQNVERAREQYRKIARQARAVFPVLDPPTQDERDDLKQCIYTGHIDTIYKHEGNGVYRNINAAEAELREISNRSVLQGRYEVIVGEPYRVQCFRGGELVIRHVIERATATTYAALGRIAAHLTEWRTEGYALRSGKFVEIQRQYLRDNQLPIVKEMPAEPSSRLREVIIEHALEHPGSTQQQLRKIKKELEKLAHLAKYPVAQLTHDRIIQLVHEAAPADIVDPSVIDNNLRIMVDERGLSLDSFVSSESRKDIYANAPASIEHEGVTLNLSYRKSKPIVRHYDKEGVAKLANEIFLPDGRQVLFVYKNEHVSKECTLLELRHKLGLEY